jgi:ribonucleoside-triphosphate reductase
MPKCDVQCEVYSRVVGYLRPVQNWNAGKREEFSERKAYDAKKALEKC